MGTKLLYAAAATALCLAAPAFPVTVAPEFEGFYTAFDLGSVAGLPPRYGGLTFMPGDPNTILIGGAANGASGLLYTVGVVRDSDSHITGFLSPTAYGDLGAYNDGGVTFGPGGVLFYSRWPVNQLGQAAAGSTSDDKIIDLAPLGVANSHAALAFVPAGYQGAGRFKMLSWSGGQFYDATLAPDGSGTFDITSVVETVVLPGGPEGFIYVPLGSPLFPQQSMLVADYSANRVSAYEIDGTGNPIASSRRDFVTGLSGAEGAIIDPLTGDFLFSTFGGGDRIVRVEGFLPPPPTAIPEPSTSLFLLSGFVAGVGALKFKRNKTAS